MNVKNIVRGPVLWVVIAVAVVALGAAFFNQGPSVQRIDTSDGLTLLADCAHDAKAGTCTVDQAKITDPIHRVDLTLTKAFTKKVDGQEQDYGKNVQFFYVTAQGSQVARAIADAQIKNGWTADVQTTSWWSSMLTLGIPFLLFLGIFWFLMMNMQGGGSRVMSFGKSRAKLVSKESPQVTFADVAGVDEALEELAEIKEFLTEPAKFQAVGAKIPKGVLLYGPPGTGKTLLARAVAGEAGVPFYSISGSDFVEMFVGVGASRVRDLFEQAKQHAPAIIFVDEIDAVGRHRGAGLGGGHDEREQTLNQMLVEMDGFDVKTNVIMIAATNRPDILDPALLRPGRFDRQVAVDPPDLKGREQILAVHAKGKPMAPGVDLTAVARRTPGFTGADLANVLNEAALLTARQGGQAIDDHALDEAIDRVVAGPQKRTRVMNSTEVKITAYHEGGHALVAAASRYTDPVTKVTILPRGRALGYTMVMPTEDKYSTTRNELLDQLAYAMGGRVAEELVFHDPTTGAANDIEKATATARKMVTQFGMSATLGAVRLGQESSEVFLGRDVGHQRDYSEDVAAAIDLEVRALLEHAHDEAREILVQYRDVLDDLVLELLDKETLNTEQLAQVFAPVVKRPEREVWISGADREVSTRPPVLSPAERAAADEKPASPGDFLPPSSLAVHGPGVLDEKPASPGDFLPPPDQGPADGTSPDTPGPA